MSLSRNDLAIGEECSIAQVVLPAAWHIDQWQDPIRIQHRAARKETVACKATPKLQCSPHIRGLMMFVNFKGFAQASVSPPSEYLSFLISG